MPTAAQAAAQADNLRPFTPETAVAAAAKSAEIRRAKRDARRKEAQSVARHLATLTAVHDRAQLGPIAAAAAMDCIGRVASGEVPIRNASEAAEWVRVLVDVARLESGEATSASIVAHIGPAEVRSLRDEARKALALGDGSAVALAAAEDDTP
jgi:hypothetical protein